LKKMTHPHPQPPSDDGKAAADARSSLATPASQERSSRKRPRSSSAASADNVLGSDGDPHSQGSGGAVKCRISLPTRKSSRPSHPPPSREAFSARPAQAVSVAAQAASTYYRLAASGRADFLSRHALAVVANPTPPGDGKAYVPVNSFTRCLGTYFFFLSFFFCCPNIFMSPPPI
jgi:hypothetical protein